MTDIETLLRALLQKVEKEYREEVISMTVFTMAVRIGLNGKPEDFLIEEIPFDRRLRAARKYEPRTDRLRRLITERPWRRIAPNKADKVRPAEVFGKVKKMKFILCFLGFHKWGVSLSTWLRPDEIFLSAKRCQRCGKIKEYAFDRKTGRELRLPRSSDEIEDFEPIWKKILARRNR